MSEEPKGTKCDWVFSSLDFNLEDLRREGLTYRIGAFGTHEGVFWFDYGASAVASAFFNDLMGLGIKLKAAEGAPTDSPIAAGGPMASFQRSQETQSQQLSRDPAALNIEANRQLNQDLIWQKLEEKRVDSDLKTMGPDQAEKRHDARADARRDEIKKQLVGTEAAVSEVGPEAAPGYQLVFYTLESKDNMGAAIFTGLPTNGSTAEFVLLKDGKPLLAGRHNAQSIGYGGNSGPKCGRALATAFNVAGATF